MLLMTKALFELMNKAGLPGKPDFCDRIDKEEDIIFSICPGIKRIIYRMINLFRYCLLSVVVLIPYTPVEIFFISIEFAMSGL